VRIRCRSIQRSNFSTFNKEISGRRSGSSSGSEGRESTEPERVGEEGEGVPGLMQSRDGLQNE
jgi:hypothetical protein